MTGWGSFGPGFLEQQTVSPLLLRTLHRIGELNERLTLLQDQHPVLVQRLRESATIRSTESSNRIEGIETTADRLLQIVSGDAEPISRPEQEIAGYRDVQRLLLADPDAYWPSNALLLDWHARMYRYVPDTGGSFKERDNVVAEIAPDGTPSIRFRPTPATETPAALSALHEAFTDAWESQRIHRLLLIPAYILDFLCIHPFADGNGRLSRLLTQLLLLRAGHTIPTLIAPEGIIETHQATYYEAIHRANQGWHDSQHSLAPFWDFFLGIMLLEAHQQFEDAITQAKSFD